MKNLNKLKKNLPATVELRGDKVFMIDQVLLPDKLKIVELKSHSQAIAAIREFNVRGAQAIGAVGGAGLLLASKSYKGKNFKEYSSFLKKAGKELIKARPTANNLSWAVNLLLEKLDTTSLEKAKKSVFDNYKKILKEEVDNNLKIGSYGSKLIKSGDRIMTHCNAGSLSAIWYGTATAPIYSAFLKKKKISVLVNETRPWLQGSRLTAWEMNQAKIDYKINIDSAIGFLMSNEMVDIVIVGADRIALNGDVANKIGTYPLALMAKEHNIPFYVAAVKATIDFQSKKGSDIEIEERSEDEILKHTSYWEGKDLVKKKNSKKFDPKSNISPKGARAFNPVFDITPAKLVTGIITEHGISKPNDIKKLRAKK